ncbi:hypothetical protein [Actinoallomurus bryophytorum]|uniref:hypothetical protein n=1 Tax=Actinoallomurus bryophytorum TaxID=1490222 RepID=UPI001639B0A6|nr:hypothetical protein [Actinoallomurus bryophytorum]
MPQQELAPNQDRDYRGWSGVRDSNPEPVDARLDGALLLPALCGAVPADDPRSSHKLEAYSAELTDDGYAYRVPPRRASGPRRRRLPSLRVPRRTGSRQLGDRLAALRWFERNRVACGSAGLLAEEYDVAERQMRDNLPQAFVHALLLECAAHLNMALAMSWEEPCESRAAKRLRRA